MAVDAIDTRRAWTVSCLRQRSNVRKPVRRESIQLRNPPAHPRPLQSQPRSTPPETSRDRLSPRPRSVLQSDVASPPRHSWRMHRGRFGRKHGRWIAGAAVALVLGLVGASRLGTKEQPPFGAGLETAQAPRSELMPVLPSAAPLDTKSSRAVRLAAASPVPEGESTVSGRVETEDGRPVSGVEVHATGYSVYQDSRTDPQEGSGFRRGGDQGSRSRPCTRHSEQGRAGATAPAKDVLLRLTSEAGAEIHVEMDGKTGLGGTGEPHPRGLSSTRLTSSQMRRDGAYPHRSSRPMGGPRVRQGADLARADSTIDVVRNRVTRVNLRAERLGTIRGIVIGRDRAARAGCPGLLPRRWFSRLGTGWRIRSGRPG
jgi:hypothetical protein